MIRILINTLDRSMLVHQTEQVENSDFFIAKASIRVITHSLAIKQRISLIMLVIIETNRY